MTTNNHRRLTAGPPEDNIPAIVDAIHYETLLAFGRAEHHAGPLDTRTALALLLRQALDELASYWPEPPALERRCPPAAIDWPDEDEPAGVTVAALDSEEVATTPRNFPVVNWIWDGRIWGSAPDETRATIRELQEKRLTWRHVEKNMRLDLARHVLAALCVPPLADYNVMKPAWMPMGSGLMSTFRLTWTQLLALGSPWE